MPHICGIIWYLSFSAWLTSLSKMPLRSTHVVTNGSMPFFFSGWIMFHCVYIPHLLYPFWATREALSLNVNLYNLIFMAINLGMGCPGGSDCKESSLQEMWGSIPGLGRSPGEGNDRPFQCSCLEKPMDRGAWWATVHGVEKESDTS